MATEKRLIDANDALERLQKAEKEMKVVSILGYKAAPMDGVIEFIQTRPTVDAEPVVHGSWIRGKVNWQMPVCSVCRKQVTAKSNYCPHCGALMDGGTQHD